MISGEETPEAWQKLKKLDDDRANRDHPIAAARKDIASDAAE